MDVNKELELAYRFIETTNRNLFLTGKAGTGKTTFLHNLKENTLKRMIVVAPTGVAAINAKGVTIHSFFQLPFGPILPNFSQQESAIKRRFSKTKINIIKSLDLLVIDEISMVRADVLDGIDEVLKRYKNRHKPFGGVQLLMIGDLQQLSPVVRQNDWELLKNHYKNMYFFSSKGYQQAHIVPIELKQIFRQQNEAFITILNEIRNNNLSSQSTDLLNKRYQPNFTPEEGSSYITLTTHNSRADRINQSELKVLTSKPKTYRAEHWGNFNENNFPNDEALILKVGAQVMFIKNDSSPEKRYYNGKIGVIAALDEDMVTVECEDGTIETTAETWENIKYSLNEETKAISETTEGGYSQIPLRLAWAITIHKSQGLTFDHAIIDAEASFAHGQTYVALSRCKTLEGMVLKTPIRSQSIISDTTVEGFTKLMESQEPNQEQLLAAQETFQLDLLDELFDYYAFLRPLNRLIDVYYKHSSSISGHFVDPLEAIKNKGVVPLVKVSAAFKKQLKDLSTKELLPENNEALQERFKKAVHYFKIQTQEQLHAVFETVTFLTDNKAVEKDITRPLEQFEDLLQIKMKCLAVFNGDFSPEVYLKTRAEASIKEGSKKTKKRKEVTSTQNTQLFETLREFRTVVSHNENIPPFQVFTQQSLYEMCELLPLNKKELKQIHGMGKVRIEKYGDEICDIIQEYCTKNDLKSLVDEVEIVVEKRDTKQVTLELYRQGKTIKDIADVRGLTSSTIEGHLAHFIVQGDLDLQVLILKDKATKGFEIIKKSKVDSLNELKRIAGDEFSYTELRLLVALLKKE